jgi:hypothetical protein
MPLSARARECRSLDGLITASSWNARSVPSRTRALMVIGCNDRCMDQTTEFPGKAGKLRMSSVNEYIALS